MDNGMSVALAVALLALLVALFTLAGLVAILDGDCALCVTVLEALAAVHAAGDVHVVALTDRIDGGGTRPGAGILHVDVAARADLFEGYAPTVLAVDTAGTVVARRFVYVDTD